MVYDPVRRVVVALTDSGCWLWNGSQWSASAAPGYYAVDRALCWDEGRRRIVAFGGYTDIGGAA